MTVQRRDFLARYPEFESASNGPMVDDALSFAKLDVDADIFGTKTDDAVMLKAAHKLAISPFGQQARLVSKDGSTTYGKQYWTLARSMYPAVEVA